MRLRLGMSVTVAGLLLLGASNASASTEVGNVCTATSEAGNTTLIQIANVSSALPIAAPTAGVVTKWKVTSGLAGQIPQRLKVFRPTGNKNEFRVLAESAEQTLVPGSNVFDTRIPVQAGDRFGLYGGSATGAALCIGKPGDVMGFAAGNLLTTDAPTVFGEAANNRVAVSAIVEPDADGDGYGDETQDKCPQLATVHDVGCPLIGLSAFDIAKKGSAVILLTANVLTPVTVSGTVKLPKEGKKKHAKARISTTLKLASVTQTVETGQIVPFVLKFPSSLKSRLHAMLPKQSLKLQITAQATNAAGQVTTNSSSLKLPGQKPK